jgi:hypothetical protein
MPEKHTHDFVVALKERKSGKPKKTRRGSTQKLITTLGCNYEGCRKTRKKKWHGFTPDTPWH